MNSLSAVLVYMCIQQSPVMNQASQKRPLLGGYFSSKKDQDAKRRYLDKLCAIGGLDPNEMERKEWKDNAELWPRLTHVKYLDLLDITKQLTCMK